jgi:carbonic anhydrase/acetyltransferase-like protein (isoleucine patch superfamily)
VVVERAVEHDAKATVEGVAVYALGDDVPDIHPDAFVHPEATVIGSVTVGAESTIWPQAVLRGDYGYIQIGARTSIQDGTVIHCTRELPTVIGDDVVVGHLAHLECCTVENGALIGTNSVVLHRAVVRSGALVGASALVPNDMEVPARAMALGIPAKLRLDAIDPAQMIAGNAANYVENGRRFRKELRRLD